VESSQQQYDLTGVHGAENFRDLPEGIKLRLTNGALAEIVGNPHDGAVLIVKILENAATPSEVGEEQAIFYPDVKEAPAL
jgi:hypothetical protein